jgi:tetratricopeptide (TPR) repeat protein
MMIIRLTQKLAKKIKVDSTVAAPPAENPFADWTANLFTVGRTQYIILTHSASLYSAVFYGRGINESGIFIDHALTALREQMEDEGHGDIFQKHIAPLAGNIQFSKTGDRSLLGSMNELVQHSQFILADESPAGASAKLNKIPMGALQYKYPRDAVAKLAGLPGTAESGGGKILPFPGMEAKKKDQVDSSPMEKTTDDQKSGTSKNPSKAVPKTPTQKRAETMKFQKEMLAMFDQLRKPKSKKQLLDGAQELIYDAWESSPARAVKLARQALEISPDCADAYVLLADLEAATIRERIDLLRQGVAAGRRALGKRFFKENEGHFWLELDSRPFMRAMAALANILWEIGRGDDAIELWREMLCLNPNDNQGVRYMLLSCLLELNRDEEAEELLVCYAEDASVEWSFGAALLAFRAGGDSPSARRKLFAARKQNPHVPPYLLGSKKIPKRLPEYISFGDETEAVSFAARNLAGWAKTPGALEWLREQQNRNSP